VDGIGRKAASRESKARITDRRTEADEVNYLADFPHPSRRESRWGACESISANRWRAIRGLDSPEAGDRTRLRTARESAA